jgi:hypothetical protein
VAAQSGQQAGGVVPAAREIRGVGEILSDVAVGFVRRVTDRSGPSPLFTRPESPRAPRGAGGAWDRRMNLGPNPDENEEPGARLGRISPSGWKKRSPGASSGGRVEML